VLALTPAAIDIDRGRREPRNVESPQARHRPPGAVATRYASRTQSLLQAARHATRPPSCRRPALEIEPHDRMAAGQGSDGGSGCLRRAGMPRGLRHSFGVNAFQSNVPPHLVTRSPNGPEALARSASISATSASGRASSLVAERLPDGTEGLPLWRGPRPLNVRALWPFRRIAKTLNFRRALSQQLTR
jgi:hypothetical protein